MLSYKYIPTTGIVTIPTLPTFRIIHSSSIGSRSIISYKPRVKAVKTLPPKTRSEQITNHSPALSSSSMQASVWCHRRRRNTTAGNTKLAPLICTSAISTESDEVLGKTPKYITVRLVTKITYAPTRVSGRCIQK